MKQSVKSKVYHCHRIKENEEGFIPGFEQFTKPVEKWLTLRFVSGEAILVNGGELNNKNIVCRLPAQLNCYSENDRCYIGTEPPKADDPMCEDANYRIVSVLTSHGITEVIFERVVKNAGI